MYFNDKYFFFHEHVKIKMPTNAFDLIAITRGGWVSVEYIIIV